MNRLYQQLNPQSTNLNPLLQSNLGRVKQMMNMFRGANNPQQLLSNIIGQNPQMRDVISFINQSGKSPKDAFYALARQQGVDPNEILKQLQV